MLRDITCNLDIVSGQTAEQPQRLAVDGGMPCGRQSTKY